MEIAIHKIDAFVCIGAELGAIITLVQTGKIKPYLTKNEAFRLYGRRNIELWLESNLITFTKDGNKTSSLRIDRVEVEVLLKTIRIAEML